MDNFGWCEKLMFIAVWDETGSFYHGSDTRFISKLISGMQWWGSRGQVDSGPFTA